MDIINLDGKKVGTFDLPATLFGLAVRKDLLQRAVLWQQAAARAGTANTKTRGEIDRTKKKLYRQKGTGGARHGAKSPSLFVGGGVTFGPRPRDFSTSLPKKVRQLALKTAFSSKADSQQLVIVDDLALASHRTAALVKQLAGLKISSAVFVVDSLNENFDRATRNIPHLKVLPTEGANVYDILRHDTLVMTQNAVKLLDARLNNEGTDEPAAQSTKVAAKAAAAKPAAAKAEAKPAVAKKAPAKKAAE